METSNDNIGKVVQVMGPVVDAAFEPDKLPAIFSALKLSNTFIITVANQCHNFFNSPEVNITVLKGSTDILLLQIGHPHILENTKTGGLGWALSQICSHFPFNFSKHVFKLSHALLGDRSINTKPCTIQPSRHTRC